MEPRPDDELALARSGDRTRGQLGVWAARGLSAAKLALVAGTAGGGDQGFDLQRFERDFHSYCERVVAAAA